MQVEINGTWYLPDNQQREFRAVSEPGKRVTYDQLEKMFPLNMPVETWLDKLKSLGGPERRGSFYIPALNTPAPKTGKPLPTVTINGSYYYDDERRQQYRLVSNPKIRISYTQADHLDHLTVTRSPKGEHVAEAPTQPRRKISFDGTTGQYRVIDRQQENDTTMNEETNEKPDYKNIPKGKFRCFINLDKRTDKDYPAFVGGRISLPDQPSIERPFNLWANRNEESGKRSINGTVGLTADQQIEGKIKPPPAHAADRDFVIPGKDGGKGLVIKPHDIVLFDSKPKERTQDDDDAPPKLDARGRVVTPPNVYGYYNPGRGEPGMRLSGWKELDRNGNTKITGYVEKFEQKQEQTQAKAKEEVPFVPAPEKPRKKARAQDHDHQQGQSQ